jgi:hypothetical protein
MARLQGQGSPCDIAAGSVQAASEPMMPTVVPIPGREDPELTSREVGVVQSESA